MTDAITLLSYGFMSVGIGTLAYYYTRAMMTIPQQQTMPLLAQRGVFHRRPGAAAVPLTTAEIITGRKLGHTDPGLFDAGPISAAVLAKEAKLVIEDDEKRIEKLFQASTGDARGFAHFHPTIADPKYHQRPTLHRHSNMAEMAGAWREMTPQYFIRRTSMDAESGQRYYELVLPVRTDLGDVLKGIAIKRLPNASNLHRIVLNISDNPNDAIHYTLGNLPKPGADGRIHLNIGDSPVMLFKMLRRPLLILSYKTDPQGMPELVFTVGTIKRDVREALRRVANLMVPFDQQSNMYTRYHMDMPHNVDLVRR